ncbi:MAG TPA: biopolymer transporter ExbD [Gammaproteobacteria bacterium]
MKDSRRLQRLARYRPKLQTIPLTSLMDVFTILVFFLLVNSGTSELLQVPRQMVLPESVVEVKPRETVVIYVNQDEVIVQGEAVVRIADIVASGGGDIVPIMTRLAELQDRVIGVRTQTILQSKEVTILADKTIPFSIVKQVMSTCTAQGYERISLAVVQKETTTRGPAAATQI